MGKLIIKNRYGTIPNDLLNSQDISFKAKGMYAYIQSKPETWEFSVERISRQVKEGLPSVASAIKELEDNGYLQRNRYQNSKGHWVVDYLLCEIPTEENLYVGNPNKENPNIGKPLNNSKQDFSKKDINNKEYQVKEVSDFEFIEMTFRNDLFNNWFNYKKERGQTYKPIGKAQLIAQWETTSDLDLERAIKHSIANNYQGLFADKNTISQVTEYKKGKFETNIDTLKEVYKTINQEIDETGRISSIWD